MTLTTIFTALQSKFYFLLYKFFLPPIHLSHICIMIFENKIYRSNRLLHSAFLLIYALRDGCKLVSLLIVSKFTVQHSNVVYIKCYKIINDTSDNMDQNKVCLYSVSKQRPTIRTT